MSLIGSIESFNAKENDITTYIERLEQLFKCNDITTEEKKVPLLLTLIGGETYGVLKNLLAPTLPSSRKYDELVVDLKQHYSPKRLIIAERFKFHTAFQEANEDIQSFVVRLKNLAKSCEFKDFLKEALRDRFVCGIRSETIKRKLLTEAKLTFDGAHKIAVAMELAEGQLRAMGPETGQVNRVFQKKVYPKAGFSKSKPSHVDKSNNQSYASRKQSKDSKAQCKRCNRVHFDNSKCPAVSWKCYSCNQMGHTAKSAMCKNRVYELDEEQNVTEVVESEESEDGFELGLLSEATGELNINFLKSISSDILRVSMLIDNKSVEMEVDSGAVRSVMHKQDFDKFFPNLVLEPVNFKLRVLTGQKADILGQVFVHVVYLKNMFRLPLVILKSEVPFEPLLGRNWLNVLNLKWKNNVLDNSVILSKSPSKLEGNKSVDAQIYQIGSGNVKNKLINSIMTEFGNLLDDEPNSCIREFKAEFKVKEGIKPIFHRAYEMPFSLKPKVEEEILKMVNSGILTKVTHSKWASPIIIVPKKNSTDIRLCVDFKKTLNQAIDTDHCVLPLPCDIFASLNGSNYFSVIDLKGAYQQLPISDASKELFTINTHIGLFRFNRLTYGVSSAPSIFQCIMDAIVSGLPKTKCYLDDILIHGETIEECHENLKNVLERLKKFNVKINKNKCRFFEQSVIFLGHKIDSQGIHPTNEKIECINKAPSPQNLTELKSYLGLLNYYGKFIHMLSAKLKPLYDLCKGDTDFCWTEECEQTFQESKKLITSENVLTYYDPLKPIFITCDSSGYGVGAVLSHKIKGVEKPVLFASSTLSENEKKYSNLERESLAIIFSLKKFHKYIYGRNFTLVTDHQPLQFIFGKNKNIPITAASRITRWALMLSAYNYDIVYKKGSLISNADGLSRLPMNCSTGLSDSLCSFNLCYDVPLTFQNISLATKKDIILSKVIDLTLSGWPNYNKIENLKPYFKRRLELSVEGGCLLVGNKVIIPQQLQSDILKLFHEEHIGIVRTKMLMRSYCWWPGMNEAIEAFISSCEICQETQNFTSSGTLLPWPSPPNNFYRVNIDFFKKFNLVFLILIDDKSKWTEVKLMNKGTNIRETILALKQIFSVFGLPAELVSDNGPPFNSFEFTAFCQANGIQFIRIPPQHPQSNGLGEKNVQTIKKGLVRSLFKEREKELNTNTILNRLENFLFVHRNTPSTSTGLSPAEALFKFRPRTRYDLLKPWSNKQKTINITGLKLYNENQDVYVKNKYTHLWQKGKIVRCMSYCTYLVRVGDVIRLFHSNDIRQCKVESSEVISPEITSSPLLMATNSQTCQDVIQDCSHNNLGISRPAVDEVPVPMSPKIKSDNKNTLNNDDASKISSSLGTASTSGYISRSGRVIKPPLKLDS